MRKWNQVHRIDGNQRDIVDVLIAGGCTVESIGRPVDVAVGLNGQTFLFEIKLPKAELRESQVKFINRWTGHVGVLRSVEDAQLFLQAQRLKQRAESLEFSLR